MEVSVFQDGFKMNSLSHFCLSVGFFFLFEYRHLLPFQVEFVNEEQCDRRLSSRINLIDLAGSECCSTAQTTGERLKVNQCWKSGERINAKQCLSTPKHPHVPELQFLPSSYNGYTGYCLSVLHSILIEGWMAL